MNLKLKNKKNVIIIGIFALIIVTLTASFAFFTYSRVGNTTTTITSGDIEFSFIEGTSASLPNAFPVKDEVGANDTTGEYTFTVKMKSSSQTHKMNYNVYLVDANDDANTDYFKNEQIKYALLKNDVFVANTSASAGVKLSEIPGFAEGSTNGEGLVLEDQEITNTVVDNYKLRIWISDDVIYTNDVTTDGTMEGKYNGYQYSLKVKVTSGTQTSINFNNIEVSDKTMTVELSDPNGLAAYAVTTSTIAPADGSSEWIEITNDSAKSNVKRTSSDKITTKTITYTVESDGVYYLHVKNKVNQISKKRILIGKGSDQTISFDANGGSTTTTSKVISYNGVYGELPTPTRNGYVFTGWYTSANGGQAVTSTSVYSNISANKLYAGWQKNKFTVKVNPNEGTYEGSTAETSYILEYQEEKNINDPTRVGYTFDKWTVTGSESSITNGIFKMGYEDATLKANWKINSYTLTVNPNGGTWNGSTTSQDFTMDYKSTKTIENPTRDGYTFTGWKKTGTNALLDSKIFTIGNGDATLEATWEANNYKYMIKHYQQNVTATGYTLVDGDTEESTGLFGTQITAPIKTYTGFVSPRPQALTITSDESKNLVEYQYARRSYGLTIDPNGGTYNNSTSNTVTEMYYGASKTIENPTPKTGYKFTNWTVSSGKITDKVFTMGNSDATLTANYEVNKYVVTFDANGGTVSTATKEVTYNSTYGTLPSPSSYSGEFLGWYTKAVGGEKVTSTTSVTITDNQTLYAHWKITATTKIISLASTNSSELRIDEHEATGQQTFASTEYRYYGATPNNYVSFNDELWRIVGVMDVDNGSGTVEKRLKIVRSESIGSYSWDTSTTTVNGGNGINEWSQADLMTLLNSGAYYKRTTGSCYTGAYNATTECDFSETSSTPGLTDDAKAMISDAKWYLGAHTTAAVTAEAMYGYERGTASGKLTSCGNECSDNVTRTKAWVGQIALLYPSDYGYSVNMTSCSSVTLDAYNTSCAATSWLVNTSSHQPTLSPYATASYAYGIFYIGKTGIIGGSGTGSKRAVAPVTYLNSNINIIDGDGSADTPFILSE